jgi:hypothetical protein
MADKKEKEDSVFEVEEGLFDNDLGDSEGVFETEEGLNDSGLDSSENVFEVEEGLFGPETSEGSDGNEEGSSENTNDPLKPSGGPKKIQGEKKDANKPGQTLEISFENVPWWAWLILFLILIRILLR